jgi:hypothetical protein
MIEGQTQIKSGDTLHLYCKVSGYPIPVIEWYRDDELIVKDDTRTNFLPYGDIPNGHLILFNVHDTDRGIYECKGSSVQFEPVKSSTFFKVKGRIYNKLKNKKNTTLSEVPKSNRKRVEQGKIDISSAHIHDHSLSWIGMGT